MKLSDFKEVSNNVNLEDYLSLYNYVRENMEHPEWLGTFTLDEINEILNIGGKIWIYYDNDIPVCSMFYIPASNKSLKKHNIEYDDSITGSLGPLARVLFLHQFLKNRYIKSQNLPKKPQNNTIN